MRLQPGNAAIRNHVRCNASAGGVAIDRRRKTRIEGGLGSGGCIRLNFFKGIFFTAAEGQV